MPTVTQQPAVPFAAGTPSTTVKVSDLPEDGMVTMVFPHKVILALTNSKRIEFPVGIQQVPASLADHVWLKQNGVKKYDPATQPTVVVTITLTSAIVVFLQSVGCNVQSIDEAKNFLDSLSGPAAIKSLPEQGQLKKSDAVLTNHDLLFLQSQGYKFDTLAQAQVYFVGLEPKAQVSFLVDSVAWKEPDAPPVLADMTKAQLVDHAQDVHNLTLNVSDKKDDLIAAIQTAAAKA
jgi:hypothetical protein